MVALQRNVVAMAALLIIGAHGFLPLKSGDIDTPGSGKIAVASPKFDFFKGFDSFGVGDSAKKSSNSKMADVPSDDTESEMTFDMPKLDESKAAFVHSSSAHKSHVKNSGSESSSSFSKKISADGKVSETNATDAKGYNKESKLDQQQESLDQRKADGSVIHKDAMTNKSSIDESDYAKKTLSDKRDYGNGTSFSLEDSQGNSHSRSAALDEAQNNENVKLADGSSVVRSSGHRKSDEGIHNNEYANSQKSEKAADGSSRVENHAMLKDDKSLKAEENTWDNNREDDGKGNLKVSVKNSNKSSEVGSSNAVNADSLDIVGKDGSHYLNDTSSSNNGTYSKAGEYAEASNLVKNADGTSSMDSQKKGKSSADSSFQKAESARLLKTSKDGTSFESSSKKGSSGASSSADESASNSSLVIGLNGARSEKVSAMEKARSDEIASEYKNQALSQKNKDGSVVEQKLDYTANKADSSRLDTASESETKDDGKGNKESHSKERAYSNLKSASDAKLAASNYSKDASGNVKSDSINRESAKNLYGSKRSENAKDSVQNADGTFSESNKGSESSIRRGDSSDKLVKDSQRINADGSKVILHDEQATAVNKSEAASRQYDMQHSKDADGTEKLDNQESKQASNFNDQSASKGSYKSAVSKDGSVELANSTSNVHHADAEDTSSSKHLQRTKKADGSLTEINAESAERAASQKDEASGKSALFKQGADGSKVVANNDYSVNSDRSVATEDRTNKFYNKDKNGNLQVDLKKKAISRDLSHDSNSNTTNLDETSADGSHKVEQSASNGNHSSLVARDVASEQGKLVMANGDTVINNKKTDISQNKEESNLNEKNYAKGEGADGSKYEIASEGAKHADLEKRTDDLVDTKYQNIGGKQSMSDKGHSRKQAFGGASGHASASVNTDDGKGNKVVSNDESKSNHVINERDEVNHDKTIVM